jgi:hypothetical protein
MLLRTSLNTDIKRLTQWRCGKHFFKGMENYAEKLQKEDFEREIPRDNIIEPFIINLRDSNKEENADDNDSTDYD